jgi:hypothetical protein
MVIKDYAVCIFGELRGVKSTIDSFYKHLIEPINADIFINCQITNTLLDDNINLYTEKYIEKKLYNKPLSSNFFKFNNLLKPIDENITKPCVLQKILNYKEIAEMFGNVLESNYKYIILVRSDFKYLFNIPDVLKLTKMNNMFWSYEDDSWGGINDNLIIIPNQYIKAYLYSYYNYLSNKNNVNKLLANKKGLNVERLCSTIFKFNNWKIGLMKSNAYISADYINERSTWARIKYSEKYNTFYKYATQFNNSQENLNIYNKGDKWKFNGTNKLLLIDEPKKILIKNNKKIPLKKYNNRILTNNYRILLSNNNRVVQQNNNKVIPQNNNKVIPQNIKVISQNIKVIPQNNNKVIPQNIKVIPQNINKVTSQNNNNKVIPQNNKVIPQNNNKVIPQYNNRVPLSNKNRVLLSNNNKVVLSNNNRVVLSNNKVVLSNNYKNWLLFKKSKNRR